MSENEQNKDFQTLKSFFKPANFPFSDILDNSALKIFATTFTPCTAVTGSPSMRMEEITNKLLSFLISALKDSRIHR